jgi:DNA-binding transcriptional MerR regulator
MYIHELAQQTGVPPTTIRYYESIGLLPPPQRGPNNYRQYTHADAERLRLLASARRFGFSLTDITEMVAVRDAGVAPCAQILATLDRQVAGLDQQIADLVRLRATLLHVRRTGATLPQDDVQGDRCVCALLTQYAPPTPVEGAFR